jgi:hypothetical protein
MQANISVGAKHDRSEYEIITNNLYPVMLLQASKTRCTRRLEPNRFVVRTLVRKKEGRSVRTIEPMLS